MYLAFPEFGLKYIAKKQEREARSLREDKIVDARRHSYLAA